LKKERETKEGKKEEFITPLEKEKLASVRDKYAWKTIQLTIAGWSH